MRLIVRSFFQRIFLLCMLSACGVSAQELRFLRYTTSDGLPSDEVYNLHQDKKGYIWAFTNSGVVKYDGSGFRPVLQNLPVDERFVYSHFEREDGAMWVASSKALVYKVVNDSVSPVPGVDSLARKIVALVNEVMSLYADDHDTLFVITKHLTYKLSPANGTYRVKSLSRADTDSMTFRVYQRRKDFLLPVQNYSGNDSAFCSGLTSLKILFNTENDTIYCDVPCRYTTVRLFKKFGDDIYFSHYDHLIRVNRSGVKYIPFNGIINNFTKDKRGHMWVAMYHKGLIELDENDSLVNHYFRHRTVNDVLLDHQQGLWVSTTGLGLFYAADLNVKNFPPSHDLSKTITGIVNLPSGLIVGTSDGELYNFTGNETPELLHLHTGGGFGHALQVRDTTYFLFQPGIKTAILGKNRWADLPIPKRKTSAHKLVLKDRTIYLVHNKRISAIGKDDAFLWQHFRERIYDLEFYGKYAFISSDNGLYRRDLKTNRFDTLLPGLRVENIFFAPDSTLLVCGPGHGVYAISGDNIVRISGRRQLPDDYINIILFHENKVVLATQRGVFVRPVADAPAYLGSGDWRRVYDGNVDHMALHNNRLFIATVRGLLLVNTGELLRQPSIRFGIAEIRSTRGESEDDSLLFESDENSLEISYDLVTLNQPRTAVVYRLTGPYSDSGTVRVSPIRFSHLPPGRYTLKLFPATQNGMLLAVTRTFRIKPAFWQTGTFAAFSVLTGIGLVFSGTIVTTRHLRRKREKREAAQNKLIEYKLIALKAQINPHFMSNCLAAIQHLIATNHVDKASDYIAKFGHLVRQILNYSERAHITINEEVSLARLYVELERLRFRHEISIDVIISEDIDGGRTFVPSLILNPIIENAIWHGLLPLKDQRNGKIVIRIGREGDNLHVSVSDNGAGLNDAAQNHSRSHGLRLIRERLDNLNLLYSVDTCRFSISDIISGDTIVGTEARLTLPAFLKPA